VVDGHFCRLVKLSHVRVLLDTINTISKYLISRILIDFITNNSLRNFLSPPRLETKTSYLQRG
jgi:hypothetical protein